MTDPYPMIQELVEAPVVPKSGPAMPEPDLVVLMQPAVTEPKDHVLQESIQQLQCVLVSEPSTISVVLVPMQLKDEQIQVPVVPS